MNVPACAALVIYVRPGRKQAASKLKSLVIIITGSLLVCAFAARAASAGAGGNSRAQPKYLFAVASRPSAEGKKVGTPDPQTGRAAHLPAERPASARPHHARRGPSQPLDSP